MTPKGQTRDPNTPRAQYLENSWRCYLATIHSLCKSVWLAFLATALLLVDSPPVWRTEWLGDRVTTGGRISDSALCIIMLSRVKNWVDRSSRVNSAKNRSKPIDNSIDSGIYLTTVVMGRCDDVTLHARFDDLLVKRGLDQVNCSSAVVLIAAMAKPLRPASSQSISSCDDTAQPSSSAAVSTCTFL